MTNPPFSRKRNPVTKQQGQAAVGAFALMIILTVTLIYIFNIGIAFSEKTKLADAADAAVYAQATSTAKRLNFAAYSNRAMAINHLAVGHTISYLSWIRYLNDVWDNNSADYFTELANVGFFNQIICNGLDNVFPACIAHPTSFENYVAIRFVLEPFFINGGLGAPAYVVHEPNVVAALQNLALDNPAIFAAQADAFAQALAINRVVTHDVVRSYVQNANNSIRVNGCELDDLTCANRNDDVQNTMDLAAQFGQVDLAAMLNDLLPAPGNDLFAGNITANEQSIMAFATGDVGVATAIKGLFQATYAASPSWPWINNRNWQAVPPPPNPCNNPINDPTGCRYKVGGTQLTNNDEQWQASDSVTNFNTNVTATGNASTTIDIPNYTPFNGGFHLPDALDGNIGPEVDELTLQILLSQRLLSNDWGNREFSKGRRKLSLRNIDEDNPQQEVDVFDDNIQIFTAYSQARVFYERPLTSDGAPQWFATFANQPTQEYANLYNPFWQARLIDTVRVNY